MLKQYRQAVDQHRQRVYSFAAYSLRAAEDAEDITQEVFIKLWQHWQRIDHDKLGAWLLRVARNTVIDHGRKHSSRRQLQDDFSEVEEQADATDVAGELDRGQLRRQLEAAVRGLDEPFRSIVILRDIQGLSYRDIEQCLEMSQSQVKVYLHRARRKLREDPGLRSLAGAAPDSCNPLPESPSLMTESEQKQ